MILQIKISIFYLNRILNVIHSSDGKAEFSSSILQPSVSQDPSEMIIYNMPNTIIKRWMDGNEQLY